MSICIIGTSISSLRNNGPSSETQTKQQRQHHPKIRDPQVHNINIHLHGKLNINLHYLNYAVNRDVPHVKDNILFLRPL